jgi:uncharacterized membrane protein YcjF (UPF0283 family)
VPDIEVVLTTAVFIGVAVLGLQVADAVLSVVDARSVRDDDEPDRVTRTRVRELFWTIAVTAATAVIVAFGVDAAGRLVWEEQQPIVGAAILLGCAGVAFAIGTFAVFAVVRRERPTYARIRRDLRDRATQALEADELASMEERLAHADRLRERRSRAGTALRAIAVIVVLVLCVLGIVTGALAGDLRLIVGFAGAAVLSVVAFVVAVRAGSVRLTALEAVLDQQRAEVDAMLERARIPQRGQVPGLRDRVTRALAILREQQK